MSNYGKLQKKRREELGISLRAFTEQVGKSVGFWSEVEGGLRPPPDLNIVEKVVETLQMPALDLILPAMKEREENPTNLYSLLRNRPNLRIALAELSKWSEEEVREGRLNGRFNREKNYGDL